MSVFVHANPDVRNGKVKVLPNEADKKLVRSQAMKSFRQEQRRKYDVLDRTVISADEAWRSHRKRSRPRQAKMVTAMPCRHDVHRTLHGIQASQKSPSTRSDEDYMGVAASEPNVSPACITHMVQQMRLYIDALTENFIDGYFAPARNSKSLASIMTHWARPTSPTFETGNNSLALLHFGAAIGDQRITKQGQRLYLDTLNMVRRDIQKGPGGSRTFESMFASAQDLLNCEIYSAVSSGFDGWRAHMAGINAIVSIPGFQTMDSVFSAIMFLQFRHIATVYALVTRSTVLVPAYCFSKVAAPASSGSIEELTKLALAVAECIELADRLEASDFGSPTLRGQLQDLETSLDEWSEGFCHIHLGVCISIKNSKGPGNRHFVSLGLAFQKCLLLLIYAARWELSAHDESLRQTADRAARELVECVPRLAATTAGEVGKALAVRAPIYFVGRWYQQSGNEEALQRWTHFDTQFRDKFPHLNWGALLPLSYLALLWIA